MTDCTKIHRIVDETVENFRLVYVSHRTDNYESLYGQEFVEIQEKAPIKTNTTQPNVPALESRFMKYASQLAAPVDACRIIKST